MTAKATTPFDALAPLRFRPNLRLTPEQFALLCAQNREVVLVYCPGDLRAKSLELLQD